MVYIRNDINYKIVSTITDTEDLLIIRLRAKRGEDKDSLISFFYREFTGGVSGLKTREALRERLSKLMNYWNLKNLLTLSKKVSFSKKILYCSKTILI